MKTLYLQFKTAHDKNVSITVPEPIVTTTTANVQAVMDQVLATNVFQHENQRLTAIKAAHIVERKITVLL